jgi:hypothetical protein
MLNTVVGAPSKNKLFFALLFLVCMVFLSRAASTEDAEILTRLDSLRKITPTKDKQELAALNSRMDAAWQFLQSHKVAAIPLVTRELASEIEKRQPDQFFMLDAGKLLLSLKAAEAEPLTLKALAKIDPASEIIQYNFQELFEFTYEVAKLGSPKTLSQIDRLFLPNTNGLEFFRAPETRGLRLVWATSPTAMRPSPNLVPQGTSSGSAQAMVFPRPILKKSGSWKMAALSA